jgi:hypothetical protein
MNENEDLYRYHSTTPSIPDCTYLSYGMGTYNNNILGTYNQQSLNTIKEEQLKKRDNQY